jgi:hypothetical protein
MPSAPVKRFVENLLPEGRAFDITATTYRVSRSNIYALIRELGTETTGAFRFWRSDEVPPTVAAKPPREVTREELDKRIAERDEIPLAVWDGKVRMSIAGVQDQLMVYIDQWRIQLLRDARGHAARCEPARLGVADQALDAPAQLQAQLGQLGRLAGTRFAADDDHPVRLDGRSDLGALAGDRQLFRIGDRRQRGAAAGDVGGGEAGGHGRSIVVPHRTPGALRTDE